LNRLSVSAAFNSIDRKKWINRWKPIIVPITGGNIFPDRHYYDKRVISRIFSAASGEIRIFPETGIIYPGSL
jgi:hypothetical protein